MAIALDLTLVSLSWGLISQKNSSLTFSSFWRNINWDSHLLRKNSNYFYIIFIISIKNLYNIAVCDFHLLLNDTFGMNRRSIFSMPFFIWLGCWCWRFCEACVLKQGVWQLWCSVDSGNCSHSTVQMGPRLVCWHIAKKSTLARILTDKNAKTNANLPRDDFLTSWHRASLII